MAWLTTSDLKALLGITGSDQDAQIAALIPVATEFIEQQIGRTIESAAYTEVYDGSGTRQIVLRNRPVTAVTSVKEDLDGDFGSATAIDSDDYRIHEKAGILTLVGLTRNGFYANPIFIRAPQSVQVVYTAGYATVPGDLKMALADMVDVKLNTAGKQGIQSESIGAYSYTLGDLRASSPLTQATIARWQIGDAIR